MGTRNILNLQDLDCKCNALPIVPPCCIRSYVQMYAWKVYKNSNNTAYKLSYTLFKQLVFSSLTPLAVRHVQHPACNKLSDELLAWLSVCSEVQIICVWSSWCHCHPIISCFSKIQLGLTFLMPTYPGCPGKEAFKLVSVGITHYSNKNVWKYKSDDKSSCTHLL